MINDNPVRERNIGLYAQQQNLDAPNPHLDRPPPQPFKDKLVFKKSTNS